MNTLTDARKTSSWALLYALLALLVLLVVIGVAVKPVTVDPVALSKVSIVAADLFLPEPAEKLQYMLGSVAFPILYLVFLALLRRHRRMALTDVTDQTMFAATLLAFVLFFAVNLASPFFLLDSKINTSGLYMLIYTGMLLVVKFCFSPANTADPKRPFVRLFDILCLLLLAYVACFMANRFHILDYAVISSEDAYHVNAYYYPVYKTYVGLTQGVDFQNLYGSYHYLLALALRLMGGISLPRFGLLMALMMLVIFASMSAFLYLTIKRKWIAFIASLAIIMISGIWLSMNSFGRFYLQYYPHRLLFPALLPLLCLLLIRTERKGRRRALLALCYALSALALFWNTETGVVFVGTILLMNLLRALMRYGLRAPKLYAAMGGHILVAAASAIVGMAAPVVITYLRTGQWLNISMFLNGPVTFYDMGFMMLPMPLIHPWALVMLYYAFNLVEGLQLIRGVRDKCALDERERTLAMLSTALSVIGIGVFVYYQGRSHEQCFPGVLWPAFLLLALQADAALRAYHGDLSKWLKRTRGLQALGCLCLLTFFAAASVADTFDPSMRSLLTIQSQNPSNEVRAIQHAADVSGIDIVGDQCDILSLSNGDFMYTNLHADYSVPLTSPVDWLQVRDSERVADYLSQSTHPLILTQEIYSLMAAWINVDIEAILNERFVLAYESVSVLAFWPN